MIVYTHHSFVDKPPHPPKPKKKKESAKVPTPKVKIPKPRDIEAERTRRRTYYQNHRDEIKLRRLRKELSQRSN